MKLLPILSFASVCLSKLILMSNDDGWASTNIRAAYRELKSRGHEVVISSPVSQRSGWGGSISVPYTKELLTNADFDYRVKGDPAWGHEIDDDHIWYFNGTPFVAMSFGLNYVVPKLFGNISVDLVVNGPNEGTNMGESLYTLSGTMGATYNAVYKGIPAIAVSASNSNYSFFKDSLDDDPLNPSNINAKRTADLVDQLFAAQGDNPRVLPLGVGLNVNIPDVGYESANDSCVDPQFVYSRMSGLEVPAINVNINETTGFAYTVDDYDSLALQSCLSGDCTLPSEGTVVKDWTCSASVSAFQIDYDANAQLASAVKSLLAPIL